jgi:hypothetical protein
MKQAGKLYDHFVHFTAIWYISWLFGIICSHFGIFFPFWYVEPRKIWQPWSEAASGLFGLHFQPFFRGQLFGLDLLVEIVKAPRLRTVHFEPPVADKLFLEENKSKCHM